ncbi:sigma-54-dependent transcriptional regulator [Nitrospina watsonii]|uniref:C4-dicarboxylate transport transcriptional regulatory protein DctD n=1 Tax=Nitrospina watsonii TaxID=1323948 RepID=A0ABN8VZ43_9BACT|nr:sigma-54 dependent transcriptional regulator [Nitrospina watsonii]CAI2718985.1 C4-dicarboxylate transport transcriptional regulatory protein DctD [Nitrospina watsonii]
MDAINKILIVDDEEIVRRAYTYQLTQRGFEVEACDSAKKALEVLTPEWPGIVITDIAMPGMDGLSLLGRIRELDPDLPVVLMTGQGDVPMAVKAIQDGAYDFLEKPFDTSRFIDVLNRALEKRRLVMEVRDLRAERESRGAQIVGKSSSVEKLRQTVQTIADCDVDVLLLGETGTGKDLVARCLHEQSKRAGHHFVAINCGAIPEAIIESELFGHEAGSFTGASKRRIGKFEHAQGGTVFLDEIESMPLHLQVKLLHVLQDRYILRVGSNDTVNVDVRVIAATKEDLKQAYAENKFRKDLYYRLNVVQIELPPLRDRKEDIPVLFQHFVLEACARYKVEAPPPPTEMIRRMLDRQWEGNVRELRNEAEKFVLGLNLDLETSLTSLAEDAESVSSGNAGVTFKEQVSDFEKHLIEQELIRQKGDLKKAQDALQIPKQTLYDKIKTFGLNRKDYQ